DGVNFTQIALLAPNATTFTDAALAAATKYFYRVRASNPGGDSAFSNIAAATTPSVTQIDQTVTYIPTGATWNYLDNGRDQGHGWRGNGFGDSSWKSGAAQLGYGDGDETTLVKFG